MPPTLTIIPGTFAVCRLAPDAPVPAWAWTGEIASVTRTSDELSIVCRADAVPDGVRCESGWRCLRVEGPLDFALTGVMASLAAPLADAGISIFPIATFDTDCILVKEDALARAIQALTAAGYGIEPR